MEFHSLPLVLSYLLSALVSVAPSDVPPPLTLEAATEIALEHANEMIQAREDVLLVDANYATALAAVMPRVDLNVSAGGSFVDSPTLEFRARASVEATPVDQPPTFFGPFQSFDVQGYVDSVFRLGLSGRQLIFDGGRWWTAIAKAEVDQRGAQEDLRAAHNLVAARVAQSFFALERARRSVEVLAAQIELDREQVERAQALLQAGRGAPADIATARRNLASDEIQRVQAETFEAQARRTFNLQLGLPPRGAVMLVMPPSVASPQSREAEVPSLDTLLDLARKHRPELAGQAAVVESAGKDVGLAQAEYWPSLALEASYNRRSFRADRVFADPFSNYTATLDLVLQWNLFDGLAKNAQVDRARVQVRKQTAQLAQLERQALSEVEDARQRWYNQERSFGFAQQQIEAAQEALRLARGLYEAGRGTSLELRTAEVELTRARIAAINARLDAETARADLTRAVGTEAWAQ